MQVAPTPSDSSESPPTRQPAVTGLHDIFYHILPHLTPDPRAPGGIQFHENYHSWTSRQALACLARSNSMFTRLALATMWRSLPDPGGLEHLLCVVGIARRPKKQGRDAVTPPLELCETLATHGSGWMRFQEYASLVREIIVDPFRGPENIRCTPPLEDTFWYRLSSAFGNVPILPRLEVATVRNMNHRSMDAGVLRLLNPPSLRELYVDFPFASKEKLGALGTVLKGCVASMQNLEVLSVSVELRVSYLDLFLLDIKSLPREHPRLRNIDFDHFHGVSIELDDLRHLAALPDLEDLTVMIFGRGELTNWSITLQALRNLTVSCTQFLVIGDLLSHVEVPQLRTLSVCEEDLRTSDMAQELAIHLHTLVTKCPALTSFNWRGSQIHINKLGYLGPRRIGAPLAELFSPLLALPKMQHFCASFSGPAVPYTPADFRTFAEAWPRLETFYIYDSGPRKCSEEDRYADVESIAAFARSCPRLRSAHIPAVHVRLDTGPESDSELVKPLATDSRHGPAVYSLRELFVCDVDVSRPGESERREHCCDFKGDAGHFRAAMGRVFPSTVVHINTESAIVLTVPKDSLGVA